MTILTNKTALPIFVKNFNKLFEDSGMSQRKLSTAIGVTQSRISYWVHGWSLPTFVNLYNLSIAFNCRLEDFYRED